MTNEEREIYELRRELEKKGTNPFSGISLNHIMQGLIMIGIVYVISAFGDFSKFMISQESQNENVKTFLEQIAKKQEENNNTMITNDDFTEKLIPLKNQINLNTGELNSRTGFMDKTDTNYQELRLENTVIKNRLDNVESTLREKIN